MTATGAISTAVAGPAPVGARAGETPTSGEPAAFPRLLTELQTAVDENGGNASPSLAEDGGGQEGDQQGAATQAFAVQSGAAGTLESLLAGLAATGTLEGLLAGRAAPGTLPAVQPATTTEGPAANIASTSAAMSSRLAGAAGGATGPLLPAMPAAAAVVDPHKAGGAGQATVDAARHVTVDVTVVRRETHLAPAAQPAAVARLAQRSIAAAEPATEAQPPTTEQPEAGGVPQAQREPTLPVAADIHRSAPRALPATAGGRELAQSVAHASGLRQLKPVSEPPALRTAKPAEPAPLEVSATARDVQVAAAPPAVQQIADRIVAQAQAAEPAAPAQRSAAVVASASHNGAVKVLYIQLQPAELGTVTVRMSLRADALDLQVEAGRHDTARLIQNDQEMLSSVLRSAGYLVDGVTVRTADPGSAQAGTTQSLAQSTGGHGQSGGAQSDARASDGQGQQQQQRGPHAPGTQQGNDRDATRHAPPPGGGIYV